MKAAPDYDRRKIDLCATWYGHSIAGSTNVQPVCNQFPQYSTSTLTGRSIQSHLQGFLQIHNVALDKSHRSPTADACCLWPCCATAFEQRVTQRPAAAVQQRVPQRSVGRQRIRACMDAARPAFVARAKVSRTRKAKIFPGRLRRHLPPHLPLRLRQQRRGDANATCNRSSTIGIGDPC